MISISRLSKSFGEVEVLSDLDLEIGRGECIGLVDSDDRASATLLAVVATLVRPTSGRVLVDGLDVVAHAGRARQRVGYSARDLPGENGLTVREYLRFVTAARGAASAPAEAMAARIGLDVRAATRALPGGMRQRLSVAAAVAASPAVALLDQPFRGVGDEDRALLASWFQELCAGGMTMVLALSSEGETATVCSRVVRLERGRGAPDRASTTPVAPAVRGM